MTGDTLKHDGLRSLWKEQECMQMDLSIDVIRDRATDLEKKIDRRNVLEWVACGVVLAVFGWYCIDAPNIVARIGAAWVMISAVYVAWRLHLHGRMRRPPDIGLETSAYLSEHRDNLLSQAKLLRGAPLWYVTPIITGGLVFATGKFLDSHEERAALVVFLVTVSIALVVASVVSIMNIRAAHKLEEEARRIADGDFDRGHGPIDETN